MDSAISQSLVKKLNPSRFTAMSGKMAAMVGYVLSVDFTDPPIHDISITSDGFMVGGPLDEGGFFGGVLEWQGNCERLFKAAGLTPAERRLFIRLHAMRIKDWRRQEGRGVLVVAM